MFRSVLRKLSLTLKGGGHDGVQGQQGRMSIHGRLDRVQKATVFSIHISSSNINESQ